MPNAMTWDEAMRRISAGEPVEDVIDEKFASERQDFRAFLLKEAGAEALARYDARLRELDLGITQARSVWHSISPAQRAALDAIGRTRTGRIGRRTIRPSVYVLDGKTVLLCRIATVRNLAAHDLLAWDGSAFDPEQAAVITERGRFVLDRGRDA